MANLRYILPLVMAPLKKKSSFANDVLREQMVSISFRLIFTLVISSVIIFSLVSVGQQINILVLAQQNGPVLSIVFFSTMAILSSLILLLLFRSKTKIGRQSSSLNLNDSETGLQKIALSFCDGLAEGLERSSNIRKEQDRKTLENSFRKSL